MDLRELLNIIDRHKHRIALLCLSAVATATLMSYVLSERFRAEAVILIRPQKSPVAVPSKEEMLDFPVSYFTPVEDTTRTYTEMLQSELIAKRIVAQLGAEAFTPAAPPKGWRGLLIRAKQGVKTLVSSTWTLLKYGRIEQEDSRSSAIREVQRCITVKPTKETFLFKIETEAKTPQLAANIANTAGRLFAGYLQERTRREKEAGQESREQKRIRAGQDFEKRQQAIVAAKERSGTLSPKKETELLLESLAQLESTRTDLEKQIEGSTARMGLLNDQWAHRAKFARSQTKEADDPVYVGLSLELEKKEVELAGLLKKFTPEHRDVKVLQSEIDELKARMGNYKPVRQSEETLAVDPVYEMLAVERVRCMADLESLKAERSRIMAEQNARRTRLGQLARNEAELAELETMAQLSEENYRFISRHFDQLELAAALDAPSIEVIQDASPPQYPARPIKIYYAGLAGVLSLLVGMGLALAAENLNGSGRVVGESGNGGGLSRAREDSGFASAADQTGINASPARRGGSGIADSPVI